ncbi:hypothetical protein BHAOGJBA_2636 [Methylobacterium hispanicum]|jgi:small multidrug resistance family-3 protein|uniref:Uncharacterized protein n=2 Tax=Methylobacteriaceae TaxID=119045 RepID=A0AAV4ZM45_9HYPH|nr:hypothetical protein BHAOGJBA_2636 [Methylobacterium hispanicum]
MTADVARVAGRIKERDFRRFAAPENALLRAPRAGEDSAAGPEPAPFPGSEVRLAGTPGPCQRARMPTFAAYAAAALAEIAGCFAFWAWLRLGRSVLWLGPGMLSLALFAWLLTRVEADAAGRAYAAYGGVYIAASILWLWLAEGRRPDRFDLAGAALCLVGTLVILLGPRER